MLFIKNCKQCGKEIRTESNNRKFCDTCNGIRHRMINYGSQKKYNSPHSCIDCGADLTFFTMRKKYCDECAGIRKAQLNKEYLKKYASQIVNGKKSEPRLCKTCGNEIEPERGHNAMYCLKCSKIRESERKRLKKEKETQEKLEKIYTEQVSGIETLDISARKALDMGISYGQYMALHYKSQKRHG